VLAKENILFAAAKPPDSVQNILILLDSIAPRSHRRRPETVAPASRRLSGRRPRRPPLNQIPFSLPFAPVPRDQQ